MIFNNNRSTSYYGPTPPPGASYNTNDAVEEAIDRIKKDLADHPLISDKSNIVYEMDPIVKEEEVSDLTYVGVATYKVDTEYNFYTDHYEDIVKQNENILEPGLPNLYILGDDKNEKHPLYKNIITVKNRIPIEPRGSNNTVDYFDEYAIQYKAQIDDPSRQTSEFDSLAIREKNIYFTKKILNRLPEINKNQYLMPYNNKITFETNEISVFMGILEQSGFTDSFCSFLINSEKRFTNIQLNLLTDVVRRVENSIQIDQELTEENLPGLIFESPERMFDVLKQTILKNNFKPPFTLGDELPKQLRQESRRIVTQYGQQITSSPSEQLEIKDNQKSILERAIRLKVFAKRYNDFINNIKIKSSEIFKNNLLYTEVLMYELVKAEKDDIGGLNPVQSFYMPNPNDIEKIDFIDSQVKYGKEYNYILNSYNLALTVELNQKALDGLKREDWIKISEKVLEKYPEDRKYFETVMIPPPTFLASSENVTPKNKKQNLLDKTKGTKRPKDSPTTSQTLDIAYYTGHIYEAIIELGYDLLVYKPLIFKRKMFSEIMAVHDSPPPPPEVQINSMMGVDDKLFFILNSSIAEFKAQPIIVQNSDLIIFSKNVLAQKLENLQDIMMFDGDDRIDYFQIFRLDHHPSEYSEFNNSFVTSSTTFDCSKNNIGFTACDNLKANHSTYLDDIRPNKKYYYMFRSIDIHGNISNPSPIYQVEMVNSDGTIFPLISNVELMKKNIKEPTKPIRRFLQIYPNMKQSLINEERSQYFDEDGNVKQTADLVKDKVVLGLTDEKIWNKKYRLKIRSKTTGKIIEIDFKFIHKTMPDDANCK
jgi:hypothetical protein